MDSCQLFLRVHGEFDRRGLLGRALRLTQDERTYSVRCDRDCFTVYRVNDKPHLPPGLPGWTVCRLSRDDCFSQSAQGGACSLAEPGEHLEDAGRMVETILGLLARTTNATDEEIK